MLAVALEQMEYGLLPVAKYELQFNTVQRHFFWDCKYLISVHCNKELFQLHVI